MLLTDAPKPLSASDEELLAECVLVMREMRRMARFMEFGCIFASDRKLRPGLLPRERYRYSTPEDDQALKQARDTVIRDPDDRNFADVLSK